MTTTDDYLAPPPPPLGPWAQHAACRGVDADLMFPGRGDPVGPAKAVCAECPVIEPCLAYAMEHGLKFGVWGGTSERERRRMRRDARLVAGASSRGPLAGQTRRPIVHGTAAGYHAHRNRGEETCRACLEATA